MRSDPNLRRKSPCQLNITPKKLVAGAAVPVAVLASGGLVWQSSYSAFSATTRTPPTTGPPAPSPSPTTTATPRCSPPPTSSPAPPAPSASRSPRPARCASTVKLYGTSYATTNGARRQHQPQGRGGHRRHHRQLRRLHRRLDGLRRRAERVRHHQDQLRHRRRHLGPDRLGQRDQVLQDHLHAERQHPGHRPGRHRGPRLHLGVPEQLIRLISRPRRTRQVFMSQMNIQHPSPAPGAGPRPQPPLRLLRRPWSWAGGGCCGSAWPVPSLALVASLVLWSLLPAARRLDAPRDPLRLDGAPDPRGRRRRHPHRPGRDAGQGPGHHRHRPRPPRARRAPTGCCAATPTACSSSRATPTAQADSSQVSVDDVLGPRCHPGPLRGSTGVLDGRAQLARPGRHHTLPRLVRRHRLPRLAQVRGHDPERRLETGRPRRPAPPRHSRPRRVAATVAVAAIGRRRCRRPRRRRLQAGRRQPGLDAARGQHVLPLPDRGARRTRRTSTGASTRPAAPPIDRLEPATAHRHPGRSGHTLGQTGALTSETPNRALGFTHRPRSPRTRRRPARPRSASRPG